MSEKVVVENINHPGKSERVDAAKYAAMKKAMLAVLPTKEPGMKAGDVVEAVKPHLPEELFPGGKTAGWWEKCVQLDLEAKQVIKRADKPPVRLYKL